MKKIIKENWIFLLIVLIGGLVGGYCLGIYSYDSLSVELLKQLDEQNITKEIVGLSTMIQYGILFGVILAIFGIMLSKKVNLWKEFKYHKKGVILTIIITIIGALILFPGDKLIFGSINSWVNEQYTISPTIYKIIGGLLVGGIIEEVMLRLFLMSLFVLIMKKLFYKDKKEIPVKVYIISNIISAILFAAGHLPSTATMTTLTPIIIFRCFLFNGGLGLAFGYLYRKYGILYAMISHGFCHLIADILMIIFI
jgi:membrane protease YdiL (CAAX protease family)